MTPPGKHLRVTRDPLTELMKHYAVSAPGKTAVSIRTGTIEEKLKARVIDGDRHGLQADLDDALHSHDALGIINSILLDGMKTVGELFGSGQMQLPFVLQSAEVMKASVAYLERFMDKAETTAKGTLVIATVKGDVHDIGKNLVDIILTNNGYRVVNLGIKCPVETMIHAAHEHNAHAIGMSGLLVKSTLVMKENLEVMSEQGITIPVVLGGAALTRRYVEQDLRAAYDGKVFYANDAFDGLRFMENVVSGTLAYAGETQEPADEENIATGAEAKIAMSWTSRESSGAVHRAPDAPPKNRRSSVRTDIPVPVPPFWGSRVVGNIDLEEVFSYVNEVALIRGQWQVRRGRMTEQEYGKFVQTSILPDLEKLKKKIIREKLLQPSAVYGYFRCQSDGDDLIVYRDERRSEWLRFTFPRQEGDRSLCLADFFAPVDSGKMDVVAFQLVTMGRVASEHSAALFAADNYRDYLYFHGLSVESAEALAELWHKRIRTELGIAAKDATDMKRLFAQGYQGSRYSFGYPACPNLEDQVKLFELLEADRIGVRLTDEFSLDPEQSTNAIIVHHPEARYFTIASRSNRSPVERGD